MTKLATLLSFVLVALSPLVAVSDQVTNQQRIAAMLSIHAHARWPDGNFDGYPFLPLNEAVSILNADVGPAADSRRRRAVSKLSAYASGHEYIRNAVESLLGGRSDLVQLVRERVEAEPHISAALLEVSLVNLLVSMTPDCPWTAPAPPSGGVRTPPPVNWRFEILVPKGVDDIALALDPQSWDQCIPFFEDTHLESTPACCPKTPASVCSITGDATEPAGKPYESTCLYERFCNGANCSAGCRGAMRCDWSFENLLCVKAWYTPPVHLSCLASCADRYDVDYHLAESLFGELMGTDGESITMDYGNLSAREATSAEKATLVGSEWSVVTVSKTLDFAGSGYTGGVGTYLQGMQDELAWQTGEHACCVVEKECWSSW